MSYTLDAAGSKRLRDSAADIIGRLSNQYTNLLDFAKVFKISEVHPSFVNNLKDAITHFRKINDVCEALDDTDSGLPNGAGDGNLIVLTQFELLTEHLTRGIVDAYVDILQHGSMFYKAFLECVEISGADYGLKDIKVFTAVLRKGMHLCKGHILDLRFKRFDLFRISSPDAPHIDPKFVVQLLNITSEIKAVHNDMLSRLTKELDVLHELIGEANKNNYDLHQVKKGETVETLRKDYDFDTNKFCKINGLNRVAVQQPLPEHKWLLVP